MSGWLFALGLLLAFALGLCLHDLALFATGGREPKRPEAEEQRG